jgi:hypothetical protein
MSTEWTSEWKSLSAAERYASMTRGDTVTAQRTVYIRVVLDSQMRYPGGGEAFSWCE